MGLIGDCSLCILYLREDEWYNGAVSVNVTASSCIPAPAAGRKGDDDYASQETCF
jgi:hypothetical protein